MIVPILSRVESGTQSNSGITIAHQQRGTPAATGVLCLSSEKRRCQAPRRLYHYHTRTQTSRAGLDQMLSEETADISIGDAARLGIADREYIQVSSRRGSVKVRARVTEEIPDGLVWMAFHFREGNANWLTNNVNDPSTRTAEYKACAVRIEKLN
jgi:anaerobic selenocysteine-containing dehydrogenase